MRDAARFASWVGAGLVLLGLAVLGWTWYRSTFLGTVWQQLPFLVSGGFGGVGAILTGGALLTVQATRVLEERERAGTDRTIDAALVLLDALRQRDDVGS